MVFKSSIQLAFGRLCLAQMKNCVVVFLLQLFVFENVCAASIRLVRNGKPNSVVLLQPGFTKAEAWAARDLTNVLWQITSQNFELLTDRTQAPERAIIVGNGPLAAKLFPDIDFEALGPEEIILRSRKDILLLAGGRPRGTIYAVSRFLNDQCGVRWWAPWAIDIPKNPKLKFKSVNIRETPAFESRDMDWPHAASPDWAVHNYVNSRSANLEEEKGGAPRYNGFVHTFYQLVPPDKYYRSHPEWYSLVNGERISMHGQLCLSNPELKLFVVEQVKLRLKQTPNAGIVSVSQNDCFGNCQCDACNAIDEAEGSPSGSLIHFVNEIAQGIEKEFPNAAIETLAYQYSRKAPKTVMPRANVIVRLCSIECNFAVPLSHPSNAAFARDLSEWSKICKRLYIWDYTINFENYIQPFPNWYSLGPNLRFFQKNKVRGVFAEGDGQSNGAEMAELRAWVLARLMWNPQRNDRAFISEFLRGYYGKAAAPSIDRYFKLMHASTKNSYLSCFTATDVPFLDFSILEKAERLWQKAEQAAKGDPDKLWRVRMGHMPVQYVWLKRWSQFCAQYGEDEVIRCVKKSRNRLAMDWFDLATGPGPAGWSKITHLDYLGLSPEDFIRQIQKSEESQNQDGTK
jgi:hypothetical protein